MRRPTADCFGSRGVFRAFPAGFDADCPLPCGGRYVLGWDASGSQDAFADAPASPERECADCALTWARTDELDESLGRVRLEDDLGEEGRVTARRPAGPSFRTGISKTVISSPLAVRNATAPRTPMSIAMTEAAVPPCFWLGETICGSRNLPGMPSLAGPPSASRGAALTAFWSATFSSRSRFGSRL